MRRYEYLQPLEKAISAFKNFCSSRNCGDCEYKLKAEMYDVDCIALFLYDDIPELSTAKHKSPQKAFTQMAKKSIRHINSLVDLAHGKRADESSAEFAERREKQILEADTFIGEFEDVIKEAENAK